MSILFLAILIVGAVIVDRGPQSVKPRHNNYWRCWSEHDAYCVFFDGQVHRFGSSEEYAAWKENRLTN